MLPRFRGDPSESELTKQRHVVTFGDDFTVDGRGNSVAAVVVDAFAQRLGGVALGVAEDVDGAVVGVATEIRLVGTLVVTRGEGIGVVVEGDTFHSWGGDGDGTAGDGLACDFDQGLFNFIFE